MTTNPASKEFDAVKWVDELAKALKEAFKKYDNIRMKKAA